MHEFAQMNRGIVVLFCMVMPALVLLLAVAYVIAERRGRRRGDDDRDGT